MLLVAKRAYGAIVEADDGKLGKLCDFLFRDESWEITSLVLEAGSWLNSYRVTVPPNLVHAKQWPDHRLVIAGLTRQQVLETPGTEKHIPVGDASHLEDVAVTSWDCYWIDILPHPWQVSDDPHLRNTREVSGYHIRASDGYIGHIADFIVDDDTWKIRYLLVDTRNWWPGKHVLVAPSQVAAIEGEEQIMRLDLTLEQIEHGRQFDATAPLDEPQEAGPRGMVPPFRHGRHNV